MNIPLIDFKGGEPLIYEFKDGSGFSRYWFSLRSSGRFILLEGDQVRK